MKRIILALGALLALSGAVLAQGVPNSATIVAACGTPPATYSPGQNKALLQNTAGLACTNSTGTVTGTVTANQGAAGAAPWPVKIDQTTPGTTNGVTVNSSALPTGAATAALQSSVQSAAGTPNATVTTIQGNASGVPVPVSGTVTITPSGTQAVNLSQVNGAAVNVGAGAASTGTQRVTTSTDSTIASITNAVTVAQPTAASLNATVVGTGTLAVQNTPTPSATVGVTTQSCTVACASTIVTGAHALYGISGSATVTGTIFVYDATSCAANGTVTPKKAFAYNVVNAAIGISWGDIPLINATGIAVCFSTTGPFTATASTTAFLSIDYK